MFSDRIQAVNFAAHTSDEIKSLGVKKITNPETYDQLLHPNYYGLYDPALGATDKDDRCDTCGMSSFKCPGHFGYIELPLPVYHPMFFKLMIQVLKGSCLKCHKLIGKLSKTHLFVRQSELLDQGCIIEAANLKDLYSSFLKEASESSATEFNLQEVVCDKINAHCDKLIRNGVKEEFLSTKNIVRCKQDLNKNYIKDMLVSTIKECPHCKSLQRKIRSEYNTKIYLKSANQKDVQRVINEKLLETMRNNPTAHIKQEPIDVDENPPEYEESFDLLDGDDVDQVGEESEESLKKRLSDQEYITPDEVKKHMIKLWSNEEKALTCLLGSYDGPKRIRKITTPEIFFLDVLAVPPSRFRPQSFMGEKRFENPQTSNLCKVLWHCKLVEELLKRISIQSTSEEQVPVVLTTSQGFQKKGGGVITVQGKTYKEQLQNAWVELQTDVNLFMDNTLSKLAQDAVPGVRQLLEKKEGLFRKHMMGKRVNFACRSVISPDPYINTDEIGVPLVFASKLTYVQPVTTWNLSQLAKMVINGPKKYPGAVMIEHEDGRKTMLSDNEIERRAVAKQLLSSSVAAATANEDNRQFQEKKVHRHLINGDILLLNRQPTLHRPSIMAHKAKVLPNERTLRLHYANCKSYNADFDGDEMNAHFPQNELGRAEAYNLVITNNNYLSPKDGKPLAGLIQDHVVSGVRMTSRDRLFNKEDYQQLVYNGLIDIPGRIKLLPPCILKPKALWSGKQIFSTVLLNILPYGSKPLNMHGSRAKISDNNWPKGKGKRNAVKYQDKNINDPYLIESQVIIRGGELMTGLLDKTQYGSTPFSVVHCMYELYGGDTSGKLLSVLARLFTAHLQHMGFTLGIQDILVLPHAESKRREIIVEGRQCGDQSATEALNLSPDENDLLAERIQEAHHTSNGSELKQLDLSMKSRTDAINNKINGVCMRGLVKKFPHNALQLMVQSGAKGSSVNCMQISCLLGQIELEGRRPPLSISGRSLPSFVPYDTSPRAGGFVDGRFLTGIRPQEYFFHCMAGREGLVDTAVKTSRSGYLQRCLIKHLEALYVQYDQTVRDGDGSVVQFLYGDDGIDVLKSQYLQSNQFQTIAQNHQTYKSILKPGRVSEIVDVRKAPKLRKKCDRWMRRNGAPFSSKYSHTQLSPYLAFESAKKDKIMKKYPSETRINGRTEADGQLLAKWFKTSEETKQSYLDQTAPCPDPVLSKLNPSRHFGAISEKFFADVKSFVESNPDNLLLDDDDDDEDDDDKEEDEAKRVSKENFLLLMWIKYMRSLVEPGEAVGTLAGQSIGEPSTQMTLNTFHFAGRGEMNVTLGIPRLREILTTGSPKIRTPQMDILVKCGMEEKAKIVSKQMNRLHLIQVLRHVAVHESLSRSQLNDVSRCRQFKIRLEFLPPYAYQDEFETRPRDILLFVENVFIKRVSSAVLKIIRTKEKSRLVDTRNDDSPTARNEQANNINESVEVAPDEPDDLADLSDDDVGDGDAADMKGRSRQKQFTSYDDPDQQQEEMNESFLQSSSAEQNHSNQDDQSQMSQEYLTDENQVAVGDYEMNVELMADATSNIRKENVMRRDKQVINYLVDEDNQWCEVTMQFPLVGSKVMLVSLIEKLAEKSVIHEAPGISRSLLSESKSPNELGRLRLKTEGVNIQHLWKFPDVFDLNSLYSNNVHAIAEAYGIEAGRSVIIKEVTNVFKVYGIHIDPRHLSLIADYMTFEGVYTPFNRIGIDTNSSPFQKMSFETCMTFLRRATAFGQPDDLGSPSSRIIVGRVIGQGTGMVDLMPQIKV